MIFNQEIATPRREAINGNDVNAGGEGFWFLVGFWWIGVIYALLRSFEIRPKLNH